MRKFKLSIILITLATSSLIFSATLYAQVENSDLRPLKQQLKKEYESQLKKHEITLKPYNGVEVKENQKELKECPAESAKEHDQNKYRLDEYCQCYYVQIDDLDPSDLNKMIAVGKFAREKCLDISTK